MRWQPKAVWDRHTPVHFTGSAFLALILGMMFDPGVAFLAAVGLGVAWEIGDAFKPATSQAPWPLPLLLTSDGFSWFDVVADVAGAAVGLAASAALSGAPTWSKVVAACAASALLYLVLSGAYMNEGD